MKIEVLLGLLFVVVASAQVEDSSVPKNEDEGMCPAEFFKKYPDARKLHKTKNGKRRHFPDFSKMPDCSADGTCPGDLKCCSSPCGMKCMKQMFDKDAEKLSGQQDDDIANEESSESEEDHEADEQLGMCPYKYMMTHPEVKKRMKEEFKKFKGSKVHEGCTAGDTCPAMHFPNFTKMADCNKDGECGSGMRCCKTPCGKKCMKGIFTDEDFYSFVNYKGKCGKTRKGQREDKQGKGKKRGERPGKGEEKGRGWGVGQNPDEENEENDDENGEGKEHGKGRCKGGKHGKGNNRGEGNGRDNGKGKGPGKEQRETTGDVQLRKKRACPLQAGLQQGMENAGMGCGMDHGEGEGQGHGKGKCKGKRKGERQGKRKRER